MRPRYAVALPWVLALACAFEPQGTTPVAELDAPFFEASVQPVLAASCASLDCHGVDGRPLRLYSEDGLRREDALRGAPLSVEELAWNVDVFEALDPAATDVDANVALTKPLAVAAGGLEHVGGDVWASREDPGYRCLRTWLAGDLDAGECADAAPATTP